MLIHSNKMSFINVSDVEIKVISTTTINSTSSPSSSPPPLQKIREGTNYCFICNMMFCFCTQSVNFHKRLYRKRKSSLDLKCYETLSSKS